MAEQLWLCLFACAFMHIHHTKECHKFPEIRLTIQKSICCCHQSDSKHDANHNHNIPGPAKQLADAEDDCCSSGEEIIFPNSFCPENLYAVTNKTTYLSYTIDIPIITKHNMRC